MYCKIICIIKSKKRKKGCQNKIWPDQYTLKVYSIMYNRYISQIGQKNMKFIIKIMFLDQFISENMNKSPRWFKLMICLF